MCRHCDISITGFPIFTDALQFSSPHKGTFDHPGTTLYQLLWLRCEEGTLLLDIGCLPIKRAFEAPNFKYSLAQCAEQLLSLTFIGLGEPCMNR